MKNKLKRVLIFGITAICLSLCIFLIWSCSKEKGTSQNILQPNSTSAIVQEQFNFQGKTYTITANKIDDSVQYVEDDNFKLLENIFANPTHGVCPDPYDNTLTWYYTTEAELQQTLSDIKTKYTTKWENEVKLGKGKLDKSKSTPYLVNWALYENIFCQGRQYANYGGYDQLNLSSVNFDNIASSATVYSPYSGHGIIIYEDPNFGGNSWTLYASNWNGNAYVAEHDDFRHACLSKCWFNTCCTNLNDRASSVRVW
jgi:hypothetical protein